MKPELRQKMLALMGEVSTSAGSDRSEQAIALLVQQPEFKQSTAVLLYVAFGHEVKTVGLLERCLALGKQIYAPRVVPKHHPQICRITSPADDLELGSLGILEPRKELPGGDPAAPDFAVVPGLAFDLAGYRLGRGGGFYDRLLADPDFRAFTCGLCFERQTVADLPRESHDQPVRALATETEFRRFIRTPSREGGA